MDDESYQYFKDKAFENIELIQLEQLLSSLPELKIAKENRSLVEFFFTSTSAICTYTFKHYHAVDELVYLDADLYFFGDPENIFKEIGSSSISIISHNFKGLNKLRNIYGKYNVGWVSFKRDLSGLKCLKKWYEQCLEWCYDKLTSEKYADQKYLNSWPTDYDNVCVIKNKGANVAPWNLGNHKITEQNNVIYVGDQPLIFFHFASLKKIDRFYYTTCSSYFNRLNAVVRKNIYVFYISELVNSGYLPRTSLRLKKSFVHNSIRSIIRNLYKDKISLNPNKKKKILFVLHLPPPIHGAAIIGKYIKKSKLINESFDCSYINLSTSKELSEIGKGSIRKVFTFIAINYKVIKSLLFNKADLCYLTLTSQSIGLLKDFFTILILKLFRIKIVYHFNNKGVDLNKDKFFYNLIYKIVFNNAQVVLTSRLLYYDIEKYVTLEKTFFCPNGIERIEGVSNINRPNSDQIKLVYLSNMMSEKGVFEVLEACKIIIDKKHDISCLFAGGWADINMEDFQKRKNELGLKENIRFIGPQYGTKKEQLLKDCDIFVFPTYYHLECFPLVILEAMQFSLPIITTHEAAIPEIVEDEVSGLLVKKRDPIDLAINIERLISDESLRRSLGVNAKQKFDEQYTLDKFEKKLVDILSLCSIN